MLFGLDVYVISGFNQHVHAVISAPMRSKQVKIIFYSSIVE